jgi:hypothetical protein
MGVAALTRCLINRTHESDELTDESILPDHNIKKKRRVAGCLVHSGYLNMLDTHQGAQQLSMDLGATCNFVLKTRNSKVTHKPRCYLALSAR